VNERTLAKELGKLMA